MIVMSLFFYARSCIRYSHLEKSYAILYDWNATSLVYTLYALEVSVSIRLPFYIRIFLGFFFQFFPPSVILLTPYEETDFKLSLRKAVVTLHIFCFLVSAMAPVVNLFAVGRGVDLLMNLYMTLCIGIYFMFFCCIVKGSFIKKAFMLFSGILFAAMQYIIVNIVTDHTTGLYNEGAGMYTSGAAMFYAVTTVLFLSPAIWFMKTIMKPYLHYVDNRRVRSEMALMLTVSLAYYILTGSFQIVESANVRRTFYPVLFTTLVLIVLYVMVIKLSLSRTLEEESRRNYEILKENARSMNKEIERSRESAHDLRHIMRQIYTLSDHNEQMKSYMDKIFELTAHTEKTFCDNECINSLMQYYYGIAVKNGICYEAAVSCGRLEIEDSDITILMGNAMENAVTAALEYKAKTDKEPIISVAARVVSGNLTVMITNSCADVSLTDDYQEDRKFQPAAAFQSIHEGGGRGLLKMEFIAAKYDGKVDFSCDMDTEQFVTRIFLPQ